MNKSKIYLQTYFLITFILWIIYQIISFSTPVSESASTLGLSLLQIRLVQLSISIPILATWLIGIWGSINLWLFSDSLDERSTKKSFRRISVGIGILVSASILSTIIGAGQNYIDVPEVTRSTTIIRNYVYVFPTLVSLTLFYISSKSLARSVKIDQISSLKYTVAVLISLSITALYSWFILTNPLRQSSSDPSLSPTFYISDIMIFSTIVFPLFISWLLGILSIMYTDEYRGKVAGLVYQSATSMLVRGKFFIVITSMFIQLLLSLGSSRLLGQNLSILLVIIYAFIVMQAAGYLFIGLGSKKLTTIENILEKYTRK